MKYLVLKVESTHYKGSMDSYQSTTILNVYNSLTNAKKRLKEEADDHELFFKEYYANFEDRYAGICRVADEEDFISIIEYVVGYHESKFESTIFTIKSIYG